ncbi:MAG: TetR/AcrR family transcriptional regulator [Acidimicrobiia bacterium]
MQAGKEVFEEDGLLDARIASITDRAGVSYGSFYHYFDSKEALFREVAAEVGERLRAPVDEVIYARNSDVSPQDRIREAMRRHFETYREEAGLLRAVEQAERFDEQVGASRALWRRKDTSEVADSIRLLQRRGLADAALDPDVAAAALGAMTYRFAELWLGHGAIECDFETGVDTVTRLFVNALGLDSA